MKRTSCLGALYRVVQLAVHVERLVVALLARVVIAERRVELHARVEKRLVRRLELPLEVLRSIRAIDVVARERHHLEGKGPVQHDHLIGQLVLFPFAGPEIPKDEELERTVPVRQRDERCGGWRRRHLHGAGHDGRRRGTRRARQPRRHDGGYRAAMKRGTWHRHDGATRAARWAPGRRRCAPAYRAGSARRRRTGTPALPAAAAAPSVLAAACWRAAPDPGSAR